MSAYVMEQRDGILNALRSLKVHTNSLACFGCGREHNCGIHGCRIIREAMELIVGQREEIEQMKDGLDDAKTCANIARTDYRSVRERNRELQMERDAAIGDIPHGCATCKKFQGGACEVLFYKDFQPNGCEHWAWRGAKKGGA